MRAAAPSSSSETRSLFAFANLPMSAQVSEVAKQPVIVRTYSEGTRLLILVLNISPFRVEAQVTLMSSIIDARASRAPTDQSASCSGKIANGCRWSTTLKLSLEPYAIEAVRIPIAVRQSYRGSRDLDVLQRYAELTARLADLANRDLSAPRTYRGLVNPSFEPLGGTGPVPGWASTSNAKLELNGAA